MASRTLLLLLCAALFSRAQLYTGSVTGIVTDPSGASVPQAEVNLTDIDRDTHSSAKTDGAGRYLFRPLPPGNYSLQVQAPDFDTYTIPKIALDVNANVTVNASCSFPAASRQP